MTTKNKSQQIRDYVAANPQAKLREVATALGIASTYVHTVMWVAKNKAAKAKKTKASKPTWKNLAIQSSGKSVKDNVTHMTPARLAELTYVISKGRAEERAQNSGADPVNHPAHYKVGGIETIDLIKAKLTPEEFRGYLKGNVLKYASRAGHKNDAVEDAGKLAWYANRLSKET